MKRISLLFIVFVISTKLFGQSKTEIDSLKTALKALIRSSDIPGAFIAITTKDSTILSEGIGYADLHERIESSNKTLFRMGSVTKVFTAIGILKMVSEKKFSLNDPVKELAPEIPISNPWNEEHPVRVIHLLEHTAGLDEMHWRDRYICDKNSNITLKEVLHKTNSLNVRWPPGTAYSYSNPGYSVAGYLLEKHSGMQWDEYLKKEILKPLQMNLSTFKTPQSISQPAKGYHRGDSISFCQIHHGPAGALSSHADDMTNFLRFLLNKGKKNAYDTVGIIPEEFFEKFETPSSSMAAGLGVSKGYALGISNDIFLNPCGLMGHPGGIAGFTSFMGYHRDSGLGYCVAINSNSDIHPLRFLIEDVLFKQAKKEEVQTVDRTQLSSDQRSKLLLYTGFYELSNPRVQYSGFMSILNPLSINLRNNTLYAKRSFSDEAQLLPTTDSTLLFRYSWEDKTSTVFSELEGQKVFATAYGAFYKKVSSFKVYTYRIALISIIIFFFYLIYLLLMSHRKLDRLESYFLWSFVLSIVLLVTAYYLFLAADDDMKGHSNWLTVSIYLSTSAHFICSFVALFVTLIDWLLQLRKPSIKSLIMRSCYLLAAASLCFIALHLYHYDLIGMKTWLY